MTEKKKPVDWADVERDYRTSAMSVREIARWHGVDEKSIRKRAVAGGWKRPEPAASPQPDRADPEPVKVYQGTVLTPETTKPEHIVERGRALVLRMIDELDATTCRNGELEALIVTSTDEADASGQRAALMQAISLKTRSDVLKSLATAAKTFAEAGAPSGVKKARQEAGERAASSGRFAAPQAPRLAVDNSRR